MSTLDPLTDSDMIALASLHEACDGVTTRPDTMDRFERAGLVRNRVPSGYMDPRESASFTSFGLGVRAAAARLKGDR